MISNALAGKPLPIYGDGMNVRDWLYVGDHCAAIRFHGIGEQKPETEMHDPIKMIASEVQHLIDP